MEVRDATNMEVMYALTRKETMPAFAVDGTVLLGNTLKNHQNIHLFADGAVALFDFVCDARGGGVYSAHYAFPKEVRGKAAVSAASAMLDFMFTKKKAVVIYGETPRDNRAARLMNVRLGFKPLIETIDSLGRPCCLYHLRRS